MKKRICAPLVAFGAAALLAACGGGGGGGSAAGADVPQGTLRMALTDAPACGYEEVWVTVAKVRVHQSGGAQDEEGGWQEIELDSPRRINLLELTNGVLEELGQTSLPAGTYNQVRLVLVENGPADPLANAVKPDGGALVPLRTPSAQQSGLKLKAKFEVEADGLADLVLDFDACRSVVRAGNGNRYNLKPVLSVAPRSYAGIQGYVSTTMTLNGKAVAVTAQQDGVVMRATMAGSDGLFVLPFLKPGSYDVVITSEDRATAVVTGVAVSTTRVSLNGTGSRILPPASTLREVSGTAYDGEGTGTPAVEALVRATQSLTDGPVVEVATTPANAEDGTYTMQLHTSPPVRAAYSAGAALAFEEDAAVAGQYTVRASMPEREEAAQDADVSAADQVIDLHFVAP